MCEPGRQTLEKIIPLFPLTGRERDAGRPIRGCQARSDKLPEQPRDRRNWLKPTSVLKLLLSAGGWLSAEALALSALFSDAETPPGVAGGPILKFAL